MINAQGWKIFKTSAILLLVIFLFGCSNGEKYQLISCPVEFPQLIDTGTGKVYYPDSESECAKLMERCNATIIWITEDLQHQFGMYVEPIPRTIKFECGSNERYIADNFYY